MNRISTFKDFVGELKVNYRRTTKPTIQIVSSQSGADFMREYFDEIMDNHEEVKVLHLNRNNEVVNVDKLTSGSDTASIVPIKDIIRNALLIKVHGIILFHNHPSGNLKPSKADISITKKLRDAGAFFDIKLLDSIILTRESYYSLADNGDF